MFWMCGWCVLWLVRWEEKTCTISAEIVEACFTAALSLWGTCFTAALCLWGKCSTASLCLWGTCCTASLCLWETCFTASLCLWGKCFTASLSLWGTCYTTAHSQRLHPHTVDRFSSVNVGSKFTCANVPLPNTPWNEYCGLKSSCSTMWGQPTGLDLKTRRAIFPVHLKKLVNPAVDLNECEGRAFHRQEKSLVDKLFL